MKVYLAGPIFGCSDNECRDWRAGAKTVLGEEHTVDPMVRDYRGREQEPGIAVEIVEQDKADIAACTAMLVYYDHPSVGTSMEVLYAWERKLQVVVWNATGGALSPWLTYHATKVVASLEEAVRALHEGARWHRGV